VEAVRVDEFQELNEIENPQSPLSLITRSKTMYDVQEWKCDECGGSIGAEARVSASTSVLRIDRDGSTVEGEWHCDYPASDDIINYLCTDCGKLRNAENVDELVFADRLLLNFVDFDQSICAGDSSTDDLRFKCPCCGGTELQYEQRLYLHAPIEKKDDGRPHLGDFCSNSVDDEDCEFVCRQCYYELELRNGDRVHRDGWQLLQWFEEQGLIPDRLIERNMKKRSGKS
jgi:hypothetical protein